MKKIVSLVALSGVVALISGCGPNPALYRKMFFPVNRIVKSGPVFQVQLDGPSSVFEGEVFEVTARTVDENNREVKADISWNIDDSFEMVDDAGNTVTLEALSTGLSFINATAAEEIGTLGIQVE